MLTYSTSIGNSFQPCAHMYTITCGQPESFCLSEKYLRSLEAPLVQNSTWRGKSNASIFKLSVITTLLLLYEQQLYGEHSVSEAGGERSRWKFCLFAGVTLHVCLVYL